MLVSAQVQVSRLNSVSIHCILPLLGSNYPLPRHFGKAWALTFLAVDWLRGVPSPYLSSLSLRLPSLCLLSGLPVPFPCCLLLSSFCVDPRTDTLCLATSPVSLPGLSGSVLCYFL